MRFVAWIAGLFAVAISVGAAFASLYYFNLTLSVASGLLGDSQPVPDARSNPPIVGILSARKAVQARWAKKSAKES